MLRRVARAMRICFLVLGVGLALCIPFSEVFFVRIWLPLNYESSKISVKRGEVYLFVNTSFPVGLSVPWISAGLVSSDQRRIPRTLLPSYNRTPLAVANDN